MKYIVAGPTIINDIIFEDKKEIKAQIGGSIFCVGGIKMWSEDCLYVSNVGPDFDRYYGEWMTTNQCSTKGLSYCLPHTSYTQLLYDKTGLHDEVSVYGAEMESLIGKLDCITAKQIADNCNEHTKGIYVEARESSEIWDQLALIKEKCNAKIMWELPTSATMDAERKKQVWQILKRVDIYSINLPEALSLFEKEDEKTVLDEIIRFGIPCFFRVGAKGSYMICDGKSYFAPSIKIGEVVDTTGCGNASTAAALFGYCEGIHPLKVAGMANISAAYNLLQYGPYPSILPEVKEEANKLLEKLLKE